MRTKDERMLHQESIPDHVDQSSSTDLWRLRALASRGAHSKPVKRPDGMLAVHQERVTYTFIMGSEVASIHYDRTRGEIFFKGHNLRNMALTEAQKGALMAMKEVLSADRDGSKLLSDYSATLGRLIADNDKGEDFQKEGQKKR